MFSLPCHTKTKTLLAVERKVSLAMRRVPRARAILSFRMFENPPFCHKRCVKRESGLTVCELRGNAKLLRKEFRVVRGVH